MGGGDVVKRFYGPAFEKVAARYKDTLNFEMYCADSSAYARDEAARDLQRKTWAAIEKFGLKVLDLADPDQKRFFDDMAADTVIVANVAFAHVKTALEAMKRKSPPKTIFIEKPLDNSIEAAMELLGKVGPDDESVWAYDHYRARVTIDDNQLRLIDSFLEGHIVHSNFYFLEDRSGSDPTLPETVDRSAGGAFEIENRIAIGNDGATLDQMSHYFPLLQDFGDIASIRPMQIKAVRYKGIYGDPERPTVVKGETYSSFKFQWRDKNGHIATGAAYVGKGVRGVKALGPEYDHNAKVFELVAKNGNRLVIDLRSRGNGASVARLISKSGKVEAEFKINSDPYVVFLDLIADHGANERSVASRLEPAYATLQHLVSIHSVIQRRSDKVIYVPGGMAPCEALPEGRPALYMEEIEAIAPSIIGPDSD